MLSRSELVRAVGRTWRQVTDAEWADLADRIERDVRPKMPAHTPDDRVMMKGVPGKRAVIQWKRDHGLLDEDNPLHRGSAIDPMERRHKK